MRLESYIPVLLLAGVGLFLIVAGLVVVFTTRSTAHQPRL